MTRTFAQSLAAASSLRLPVWSAAQETVPRSARLPT